MNRLPKRVSGFIFVTIVVVMLTAGLTPGGYRFRNQAEWLSQGPGIRFSKFGMVHTQPFLTGDAADHLNRSGMTLLLALTPSDRPGGGFQFIASLHNGDDASQFVVGQFSTSLIVMNGNDYSHKRGLPRISADLKRYLNRPTLFGIVTGPNGTMLSIEGQIVERDENLKLLIPPDSRLTLGNSVHAENGWTGSLLGFAVLARPLTAPELVKSEEEWGATHDLGFLTSERAVQLFRFDEKSGDHIRDASGAGHDAILPARSESLVRSFLTDDPTRKGLDRSRIKDLALNFLGFVPFGLILAALVGDRYRNAVTITLVAMGGFVLSLSIETIQAWMPSRSSSLLDLLINTAGAFLGAWIAVMLGNRSR